MGGAQVEAPSFQKMPLKGDGAVAVRDPATVGLGKTNISVGSQRSRDQKLQKKSWGFFWRMLLTLTHTHTHTDTTG